MHEIMDQKVIRRILRTSEFQKYFSIDIKSKTHLFLAKAGERIFEEGEETQWLLYMTSGRAKLRSTSANGKTTLLDFPKAPWFLGEIELFGTCTSTLEVKCLEDSYILGISTEEYGSALLNDNLFLRNMCRCIAQKETKRVVDLMNQQGFPLKNRLADFILRCSVNGHYKERNADAAEYLGVSYRHLQEVMSDLIEQHILIKEHRIYTICNNNALIKLASEINQMRD